MNTPHWSRRAFLQTVAALPLPFALASATEPDSRCFELRTYTANPGKLEELHARFRNHTMALFVKHGMTNIGYWVPTENPEAKLVYLLAYPSKAARETSWKAFQADPEWQKAKAASEVEGALVSKVEQRFLQATDFSPLVQPEQATEKRVFELRTYLASNDNLPRLLQRARANTDWLFKAYGIGYLGIWTLLEDQPEADRTLIYLLAHPSDEAGESAFRKLRDDPKWVAIRKESEAEAGGSLTLPDGIISLPLTATDYSPMQ